MNEAKWIKKVLMPSIKDIPLAYSIPVSQPEDRDSSFLFSAEDMKRCFVDERAIENGWEVRTKGYDFDALSGGMFKPLTEQDIIDMKPLRLKDEFAEIEMSQEVKTPGYDFTPLIEKDIFQPLTVKPSLAPIGWGLPVLLPSLRNVVIGNEMKKHMKEWIRMLSGTATEDAINALASMLYMPIVEKDTVIDTSWL